MIRIHCPLIDLTNDEVKQIIKPGIMNSEKCELVSEQDAPWKAGPYKLWHKAGGDPTKIPADVLLIHGSYGDKKSFQLFHDRHPQLPVIMVDYKDHADRFSGLDCINFNNSAFFFKRSVVNPAKQTIYEYPGIDVNHAPYCVREDLLEAMNTIDVDRDIEVSCFFPVKGSIDFTKGVKYNQPRGHSRGWISSVVDQIDIPNKHVGTTATVCQNAGRQGTGLNEPGTMQHTYATLLKRSKIIVTACPSGYEGDYRLFEAMSSGALVMHNRMTLSPSGLVDGEHWILYDNSEELRDKIMYYYTHPEEANDIARNGYDYVINNHRPHHRIEEWLSIANLL